MNIEFNLNGSVQKVVITSVERAIDVLTRQCGITSLSGSCLEGQCGSCLILLDGKPVYSCLMSAFMLRDHRVETTEYFTKMREYSLLNSELTKEGNALCSSCQSGIMLMGMMLIRSAPAPTREEIFRSLSNVHCDSIDPDDFADAVLKIIQHLGIARKMP